MKKYISIAVGTAFLLSTSQAQISLDISSNKNGGGVDEQKFQEDDSKAWTPNKLYRKKSFNKKERGKSSEDSVSSR